MSAESHDIEKKELIVIGWREWIALPALGIEKIKAKIDTGARTAALHAFSLRLFHLEGKDKISFDIHPLQHSTEKVITCTADVIDKRWVTDSGGHKEERFVIETPISLGKELWMIEVTLTERETMLFRMLLGRGSLRGRFAVDPARSFVIKRKKKRLLNL